MAKQVKKSVKKAAAAGGRVRQLNKKQAKTKAKSQTKSRQPVIGSFKLTVKVFQIFKAHWRTLGGVVVVYLLLNIVFASGISNINTNFSNIKADINTSGASGLWHAAGGFTSLVGSAGASGSSTASVLQTVLFIIESLAIIWALRHLLSGQAISVKQAYYQSMYPLIPFLLVIGMVIIQLLPISIGGAVLGVVATSVFTSSGLATAVTAVVFAALAVWSIYMVSASIFSLYIVTLPDMQPRQALRSAKDLVKFRRLVVIRRLLFLPLVVMVGMGIIAVPLIVYAKAIVPAVFYALSMLSILFIHTYLYNLYRSLLE